MLNNGSAENSYIESLRGVFEWARAKNFLGNDPHDILMSPLFRTIALPTLRLVLLQLGRRSPINLRTLLGVPPMENPKALALFLMSILESREKATDDWKLVADDLANRLLASQHPNGGWGYPFHWQSRTHYLPAGTPTIVCTAFVGKALLKYLDSFEDSRIEETLKQATSYILNVVPRIENERGLSFVYAENDPQIVFNASLLGAELLARIGARIGNAQLLENAVTAARFVQSYQGEDGAWRYGLESSQTWVDNFHTGFVLDSLDTIGALSGESPLVVSAQRGFEYYRDNFFIEDGAPKYYQNALYPIDSHSAAQSIITLIRFGDLSMARLVANYTIAHLQSPKGYFYYQRHQLYTNKIPYIRWSNAWMFRALSELVVAMEKQ